MADRGTSESWNEYRRLVLAALERLDADIEVMKKFGPRIESLERLAHSLRKTVYGEGDHASLQARLAELEEFVSNHPVLKEKKVDENGKTVVHTNKKMLVLLVGAISGLVAMAKTLVDVILNLLEKLP